jgi:hypothetical protein
MNESGLVVIKRYRADGNDAVSMGAMRRVPALNLEPSEVLLRYRGLDGQPWPREFAEPSVEHGLAPIACLEAVLEQLGNLRLAGTYDLLYCVCVSDGGVRDPVPAGFMQLGLDYGFYRGEDETYSVLFHEVLLGREPDMRKLSALLNENLLLPDAAAVQAVSTARDRLVASGADLENAEGDAPRAFLLFGYIGDS